jgi:hypothetical protein
MLLTGLSKRPAQHQDMLLRMFVSGLQPGGPKREVSKKEEDYAALFPFLAVPEDRKLWLDFVRDCLLYTTLSTVPVPPPHVHSHGPPGGEEDAAMGEEGEEAPVPAAVPAPGALAPPGLSKVRVQRVVGKITLDGAALIDLKMGVLNFMAAVGMKGEEALVHYLVRHRPTGSDE